MSERDPLPVLYEELPPAIYTDPSRFDAEMAHVFGRHWLLACHVADLPATGAASVSVAGRPLVVTRDGEVVRAFDNVCSHRGAELVDGCQSSARLRCGFHGWTYALDGRLLAAPGKSRFGDGFDMGACGLPVVHCEQWGGFVWVHFGEPTEPVGAWLGEFGREIERYRIADQRVFGSRVDTVELNWKASLDAFNETYHVAYIHRETVGRLVTAKHTWFAYDGDHAKAVIPVEQSLAEATGRRSAGAEVEVSGKELLAEQAHDHCNYTLFPNVIHNALPTWAILIQFNPVDAGRTELRTWMVADKTDSERRERAFEAQWQEFNKVLEEDLEFIGVVARGLRAATTLRFGGEEEKIVRFHRRISELTGIQP
jgi:phenylpropionate dioxygenase-like ring-hydroxylating dioxygenase large terminal subunit